MPGGRDVLSRRSITVVAICSVAVTCIVLAVLLVVLGSGTPEDAVRLTAIQTAGSIGLGAGGAVALYLAALRQRTADLTLELQRSSESSRDRDAHSRRVTDLYTSAAEQLGNEDAVARLAGVYALERLADEVEQQRQPVVNVLCAYLRMPFDAQSVIDHTAPDDVVRERTVRSGVQRLLQEHLRPARHRTGLPVEHWSGMVVDLSRAQLIDADFTGCRFGRAEFARARFLGHAQFGGTEFSGDAFFGEADFAGDAWFCGSQFLGSAFFDGARFRGDVHFRALPEGHTGLTAVEREKSGPFISFGTRDASFARGLWLPGAKFVRPPRLDPAHRRD